MKIIICKCFQKNANVLKKETNVIIYIIDDLEVSSDDSDESDEE